jgi:hypothetical protein
MPVALPTCDAWRPEGWLTGIHDDSGETHFWPNEEGHVIDMECPCGPRRADETPLLILHRRLPKVVQ